MALPVHHPLESSFAEAWPARDWLDSHVLLAVSGGADSVAMLRAAVAVKEKYGGTGRQFVAHLDHGLRGDASAADAAWLEALCGRLRVPIEIHRADVATLAKRQGDGLEAAARMARYKFLQRTAEALGARYVAVAHTADDQVETVLHRILRGTGIDGLRGIPAVRPLAASVAVVRPLLTVRRRDVLDYLRFIGQDFRTDASNADLRLTRNRLRHELLPAIREFYDGDVDAALLRLSAQASETHDFIAATVLPLANDCVTVESAREQPNTHPRAVRIRISCDKLATQPPLVIREVCKSAWRDSGWPRQAMGYDQWQQLAVLVVAENHAATLNLPGGVRAAREGSDLVLERAGLP